MRDRAVTFVVVTLGACLVSAISYALACAGEPQSFWLWHNVFGVM